MASIEAQEVDFAVINEDYSRYLAHDGTTIKAKVVVKKIFFNPQKSPEGYPINIGLDTMNAVSAIVPASRKGIPSTELFNPQVDKGEEVKFEEQEVKIQEYMTPNGFKITVKPVVTKIFRYKKNNMYGEPIYNVVMQAITNIDKLTNTST